MDLNTIHITSILSETGLLGSTFELPAIPFPDFSGVPLDSLGTGMGTGTESSSLRAMELSEAEQRVLIKNPGLYKAIFSLLIFNHFTKFCGPIAVFSIWFYGLTEAWCGFALSDYPQLGYTQLINLIHSDPQVSAYWYTLVGLPEELYTRGHEWLCVWTFDRTSFWNEVFWSVGVLTCAYLCAPVIPKALVFFDIITWGYKTGN